MNSGDFVYINFIGRIKDTGEIIDTSYEDVAKKENTFNPENKYGPMPAIVDANLVLPGLNDGIKEMKVGEKKEIEIPVEKGFGKRNEELVKLIPLARFKKQDIDATPGSFVTINRVRGKIASIDGGRVKVDFNHPLAGKVLKYELEIVGEIKDTVEKVKAVVFYFMGIDIQDIDAGLVEKTVEIQFKKRFDIHSSNKSLISNTIIKWIQEIEQVKFVDVYKKEGS